MDFIIICIAGSYIIGQAISHAFRMKMPSVTLILLTIFYLHTLQPMYEAGFIRLPKPARCEKTRTGA
jgi:hypothetical protein